MQVVGIYALPAALEVTPSCFAKRLQAKIGSLNVRVVLPHIEWEDDRPRITAPPMDPGVAQRFKFYIDNHRFGAWFYWGQVSKYNPSKRKIIRARLSAILLECKLDPKRITYSDSLHERDYPDGPDFQELFQIIDDWFEHVRTWVETVVDQDADPIHSLLEPTSRAAGLQILTIDGNKVSLPAIAADTTIKVSTFEPIAPSQLRTIFQLVSSGATPSDAHLLLRDSRAEWRRGRYRRAVIDAGSATEITLADFNTSVTRISPRPGNLPTLGWYVGQRKIAYAGKLPPNIRADLVEVRNKAIHENKLPTRAEAMAALAVAKQVVDRLDPLLV